MLFKAQGHVFRRFNEQSTLHLQNGCVSFRGLDSSRLTPRWLRSIRSHVWDELMVATRFEWYGIRTRNFQLMGLMLCR
jgi:hypothetical protein